MAVSRSMWTYSSTRTTQASEKCNLGHAEQVRLAWILHAVHLLLAVCLWIISSSDLSPCFGRCRPQMECGRWIVEDPSIWFSMPVGPEPGGGEALAYS